MAVWWSLGRCPLSGRWATGTVNSFVSLGLDSSAGKTSVSAPQDSRWTPPLGNAKVCKDHPMQLISLHILLFVCWYSVYICIFQWRTLLQWCQCWRWLEDFLWSRATTMLWFLSEDQVTFDESTEKFFNDFLGLFLTHTIYVLINITVNEDKFKHSKCWFHLSIKKEHIRSQAFRCCFDPTLDYLISGQEAVQRQWNMISAKSSTFTVIP